MMSLKLSTFSNSVAEGLVLALCGAFVAAPMTLLMVLRRSAQPLDEAMTAVIVQVVAFYFVARFAKLLLDGYPNPPKELKPSVKALLATAGVTFLMLLAVAAIVSVPVYLALGLWWPVQYATFIACLGVTTIAGFFVGSRNSRPVGTVRSVSRIADSLSHRLHAA